MSMRSMRTSPFSCWGSSQATIRARLGPSFFRAVLFLYINKDTATCRHTDSILEGLFLSRYNIELAMEWSSSTYYS